MGAPVLIVGQGLAGTALGLTCEEAGVEFVVADSGTAPAASRVAAGLVNPVAGRRWTLGEDFPRLGPLAAAAYQRWGRRLGAELWHPLALVRRCEDAAERELVRTRWARGQFGPYAQGMDEGGLIVRGAARVDVPLLLARAAAHWEAAGRLRRRDVRREELEWTSGAPRWRGESFCAVVLCTGASLLARGFLGPAPLVPVKGEVLVVGGAGISSTEARLARHWLVGEGQGRARVGATYDPGREDLEVQAASRAALRASAEALAGRTVTVLEHAAGVRLAAPDRRPVAGWIPGLAGLGTLLALGSKGVLRAPELAERWVATLRDSRVAWPATLTPGRWLGRCP